MTLREFIINESCGNKKLAAKDFDEKDLKDGDVEVDDKDMENDADDAGDDEGEKFTFVLKVTAGGDDEKSVKKAIKDALADFEVKFKEDKKKDDGDAAKKFEGVCPQCGKKFSKCECR